MREWLQKWPLLLTNYHQTPTRDSWLWEMDYRGSQLIFEAFTGVGGRKWTFEKITILEMGWNRFRRSPIHPLDGFKWWIRAICTAVMLKTKRGCAVDCENRSQGLFLLECRGRWVCHSHRRPVSIESCVYHYFSICHHETRVRGHGISAALLSTEMWGPGKAIWYTRLPFPTLDTQCEGIAIGVCWSQRGHQQKINIVGLERGSSPIFLWLYTHTFNWHMRPCAQNKSIDLILYRQNIASPGQGA